MWSYILRRLAMMPPVLLAVSLVAFSIILLLPGDPAVAILGEERSHDRVAYAALQCAELLRGGAPGIHFYTLNRSSATRAILSALRASEPWRDA